MQKNQTEITEIANGCKAVREPRHMCSVSGSRMQWKPALPGCPLLKKYVLIDKKYIDFNFLILNYEKLYIISDNIEYNIMYLERNEMSRYVSIM